MKWLIIQSNGAHNGSDGWTPNDYLRECFGFARGLLNNGIDVDIWGKRHKNFDTIPDFNSYDYILLLENYEWDWVPDLSQFKKPVKLHWIIDLHCQNPYVKWSSMCDFVLHSTKSLIPSYQSQCPSQTHIWFPNAVDDKYFYNKHLPKKENICFVGSVQNRGNYLTKLNIPHYFRTGVDMINTIGSVKIHFNKSIANDVNYRCFETIGLGTCLVTNYIPEMNQLGFKDGENCIFYNSLEECRHKINQSFATNNWISIGENGGKLAINNTYTQRIKQYILPLL